MSTSSFVRLKESVPPQPGREVTHVDWVNVERALGTELPADYKQLVEAYGPGSFDDFLWLLLPMPSNLHLDLVNQQAVRLDALRSLQAGGELLPQGLRPEYLIAWATTDNGDVCYWSRGSADGPEKWIVAVNEARGLAWETFKISTSEFLVELLSGALRVRIFPDDFPSVQPVYNALT